MFIRNNKCEFSINFEMTKARVAKYGNKKSFSGDGLKFDSVWERDCYNNFRYMQLAGEAKSVRCQVRYNLTVNGLMVCAYIADFVVEYPDGREVIYDSKGVLTDVFNIKRKLMRAVHNLEIVLLKKNDKSNYPWLNAGKV